MNRRAILRLSFALSLAFLVPASAAPVPATSGTKTLNGKTIKYQVAGNKTNVRTSSRNGRMEMMLGSGASNHQIIIDDSGVTLEGKKKEVKGWQNMDIKVSGATIEIDVDGTKVFPEK